MNQLTTVCIRYHRCDVEDVGPADRPSIGKPGSISPETGLPFHDSPYPFHTWKTRNGCCETCGEMLGTSRPKYSPNRWPATVTRCTCEHCGKSICTECVEFGYRTNQVIGTYRSRTSGGNPITKPRYRYLELCQVCGQAEGERRAALPKQPSAGTILLRSVGLLRQDEEI